MRPALLVAALLGALALASSALAKGPIAVCGSSGCVPLAEESQLGLFMAAGDRGAPAAPAAFFTLVFAGATDAPISYWVPSAGVFRSSGGAPPLWTAVSPDGAAALAQATSSLTPFAAPKLDYATVGSRDVRSPHGYLKLYTVGTPVASAPGAGGWIRVFLDARGSSPWADGSNDLWVSRRGAYLSRDGQLVAIPPALARRIRAGAPL